MKVVVTGPFAAGKTTLIRSISEISVLSTEQGVTDETRARKAETTVAMDFGRIGVARDLALYIFGTPGQDRFDFMWEVLGEGMLGYVLLLDGSQPNPAADAQTILTAFRGMSDAPFVVAVNRAETVDVAMDTAVRTELGLDPSVPVLPVDATDRESVKSVLLALLYAVLERLPAEAVEA